MAASYLARVDMTLLMPEFCHALVDALEQLRNSAGITYRAYLGYRSFQEQQTLYDVYLKGGPRAAPPWKSAHQFGIAIDVQAYNPGPTWDESAYRPLWGALDNHPLLRSGHSFGDGDHIEFRHPAGPWDAERLAVLPRVGPSDLMGRVWPLVRTTCMLAGSDPGTPSAPAATP